MPRIFQTNEVFWFVVILNWSSASKTPTRPCSPIQFEFGMDCKCYEVYCDTLDILEPENKSQAIVVRSTESGDRFFYDYQNFTTESESKISDANILVINQTMKYIQSEILGFGGAWTGSVRYILNKFPPTLQNFFYESYYAIHNGIGYNLLRISIGGVDFELAAWTYDMQTNPDPNLLNFTELNGWDKIRNKQIKNMQQTTNNKNINVFAAAWSPPLWMKANHQWNGSVNNQLLPEYYESFGNYHARWLNLTNADGIRIYCISTGNEPVYSENYSPAMIGNSWEPANQAEWLMDSLAPALERTGLDVKINIYDDTRNGSIQYLQKMTERRSDVMNYSDIIAMHGYFDAVTSPQILDTLHQTYGKPIVYTEMSFGLGDGIGLTGNYEGICPGSWIRGEALINILMETLNHNVAGYIGWNLMLDSNGGPSYVSEAIDAFIISNHNFTEFYKQPMFYVMAHFAKFIPRHSLRISATSSGENMSQVQTVAYLSRDNRVSIVMYNNATEHLNFTLYDIMRGEMELTLKPKSLNTIIYSNE